MSTTPTKQQSSKSAEQPKSGLNIESGDFNFIIAKAILEKAEQFINEQLRSLSALYHSSADSRDVEELNRQLQTLTCDSIEKVLQSLRSNLAVNPAIQKAIKNQSMAKIKQNTQKLIETNNHKQNDHNQGRIDLEFTDLEAFIDRILEEHINLNYAGKSGSKNQRAPKSAEDQATEQSGKEHQDVKTTCLIVLLLQRLYLNEIRQQRLNKKLSALESAQESPEGQRAQQACKTLLKKTERALNKLEDQVKKHLSAIQLKYEMLKFREGTIEAAEEAKEVELAVNFDKFLTMFIVPAFANRVPALLTRVFTELNLSDSMIKEVQKNKRQRKSSIKRPQTTTAVPQQQQLDLKKTQGKIPQGSEDQPASVQNSAKKSEGKQSKQAGVPSRQASKSPKSASKRKSSPVKAESNEPAPKAAVAQAEKNYETPKKSQNNSDNVKSNQESTPKQNLLQKRTFTQITDCINKQAKKIIKSGSGKENEGADTRQELFTKAANLDQKKLIFHFNQYSSKGSKTLKVDSKKEGFLKHNQNHVNTIDHQQKEQTQKQSDPCKSSEGNRATDTSQTTTKLTSNGGGCNHQLAIQACFQNSAAQRKPAPARRFKAQGITTAKPKNKTNFVCQQTAMMTALSAKQELEKKSSSLLTKMSKQRSQITQHNTSVDTSKASKVPVLSNSLLIEGSSKQKQGSVLSRLKSRGNLKQEKPVPAQLNQSQQVQTQSSSSNDKSSLGKITQSGSGSQDQKGGSSCWNQKIENISQ